MIGFTIVRKPTTKKKPTIPITKPTKKPGATKKPKPIKTSELQISSYLSNHKLLGLLVFKICILHIKVLFYKKINTVIQG